MPHVIVEYTDNLAADGDIAGLLETLAAKMVDSDGVFPIGGVRVRALRLDEYVIADGRGDYAFVNVTVKIGAGRPEAFKTRFFGEMFDLVKTHFAELMRERLMALSLYIEEADDAASFKANTLHQHFKAAS